MRKCRWLVLGLFVSITTACASCEVDDGLRLPSRQNDTFDTTGLTLVARIFHISDTHVVDEESPARFAGAQVITTSAWRPYEAYSTQLFDGIVRTCNRLHASGLPVSFLVHTGDACDNSQVNELDWFTGVFDGEIIDPLTGPDDRPSEVRPATLLDPHAAFQAQGLYRQGVHGNAPSIPWYGVFGNHDVYAIGVFPFFEELFGRRTAPLPLEDRPDILLPGELDPVGFLTHGKVTPANPGPPELFELRQWVEPNPARAFYNKREFIRAMFDTVTGPEGHGFSSAESGPSWYSVSPLPGLRLIGLDTCDPAHQIRGFFYQDGSILTEQLAFLRSELTAAQDRGELVIVASHHPSAFLRAIYGSAVVGSGFRAILNEFPNVILHLAGHTHVNRVTDRETYVEIETCSTLDLPQEGRLIEIWQNQADGSVAVAYAMFSHLDDTLPALNDDPLRRLREQAQDIASNDDRAAARQKERDPSGADPRGRPKDRIGVFFTTPRW
ncbi:MAG: metallophosphoesterase [Phycisphaerales bacterium]|nr:metallophosphoesterase [Phycisphaerales bacterium]